MNEDEYVILNVGNDIDDEHVSKKDILKFFKKLKTMPTIDTEEVYQDILNEKYDLPNFKFEELGLRFCKYKDNEGKNKIIIKDIGSAKYFYIIGEEVFVSDIDNEQEVFYSKIAKGKNQTYEDVHDTLISHLEAYEAVFLENNSKYLCSLNDFIEDNIYMFDNAVKEKLRSKKKYGL